MSEKNNKSNFDGIHGEIQTTNIEQKHTCLPDQALQELKSKQLLLEEKYNSLKEDICCYSQSCLQELSESIEPLSEGGDLNDFLNQTIHQAFVKLSESLNSHEGVELSAEGVYRVVLDIIDDIENIGGSDNVYIKSLEAIKNNFFLPKEKGIKFIGFILEKSFGAIENSVDVSKNNELFDIEYQLDRNYDVFRSAISMLLDTGKNLSDQEMQILLNDIKQLPFWDTLSYNGNNFESSFIHILSSLSSSTQKDNFLLSLDSFYGTVKTDLSMLIDGSIESRSYSFQKEVKLGIFHSTVKFFDSVMTKQTLDTVIDEMADYSIVQSNPIFQGVFDIINDPSLSLDDKMRLLHKLNEGFLLLSDTTSYISGREHGENIALNNYLNELGVELNRLTLQVPQEKITAVIQALVGILSKEEKNDSSTQNIDYYNLLSFISDNKSDFLEITRGYVSGNIDSMEEAIARFLKGGAIQKNFEYTGGKLAEKIQKTLGVNASDFLGKLRDDFVDTLGGIKTFQTLETHHDLHEGKEKGDYVQKLLQSLQKNIVSLLLSKIHSSQDHNLTKNDISEVLISTIRSSIDLNPEEFLGYIEEAGIMIGENEGDFVLHFTEKLLHSSDFQRAVNNILTNGLTRISRSGDSRGEIEKVLQDIAEGDIDTVMGLKNKQRLTHLAVDSFYEVFLHNGESIQAFLSVLKMNVPIDLQLSDKTITGIIETFRKHIPSDKIKILLKEHPNLFEKIEDKDYIKRLAVNIYSDIEDKIGFLYSLSQSGILNELSNGSVVSQESLLEKLSEEDITQGINLVYDTLNSSNKQSAVSLIDRLVGQLGLKEVVASTNLFGNSTGENLLLLLNSIDRGDLIEYVLRNKNILIELSGPQGNLNLDKISRLGTELLLIIDMNVVQEGAGKASGMEKVALGLSDELQNIIERDPRQFKWLVIGAEKLRREMIYGETSGIDVNLYGYDLFQFLHGVIKQLDQNYLSEHLVVSQGGELSPELERVKGEFIQEFLENNFWFVLKSVPSVITDDKWEGGVIDSYFRNIDNTDNFSNTLQEFFEDIRSS